MTLGFVEFLAYVTRPKPKRFHLRGGFFAIFPGNHGVKPISGQALANGWTPDDLQALFAEFERRRPTWGDTIKTPLGLLHTWLTTHPPDAPIPWPESTVREPHRPKLTPVQLADSYAQDRRRELKSLRKHSPEEIDPIIRSELRKKGFSAEVRAAVGYPEPETQEA